jgi:hypothetical protein
VTVLTDTQVVTASGGLVELGYSQITSDVTISSFTAGSGTTVISALTVVCDGSPVLVELFAPYSYPNANSGDLLYVSLYRDGTELIRQWTQQLSTGGGSFNQRQPLKAQYRDTPSAGSHTYDVRAYVSVSGRNGVFGAGTGTGTTAAPAFLRVSKIVQATQWPAVTTGTIICTSSTRPASPFAGQQIYETDTSREFTYVGTQWVPRDGIYTTEALRDAAIPTPFEGQRAYITASTVAACTGDTAGTPPVTGIETIYNGSVWVCVTPISAHTATAGTTAAALPGTATLTSGGTNPTVTLSIGTDILVTVSCFITGTTTGNYYCNFTGTGANTIASSTNNAVRWDVSVAGYGASLSKTFRLSGLTAGTQVLTLNYSAHPGGTGTYGGRAITAQGIA